MTTCLPLFTFTGGIPKYIESFMDNGCTDMKSMVDWMMRQNSMFQNEGQALLIQEFGRKYGNYFAILSAIAGGDNTLQKLSRLMGDTSINGHLKRLEFERLGEIIKDDYPTYSGLTLEKYFIRKLIESKKFAQIGSWWQTKQSDPCEADIVAVYAGSPKALVAEVKRQRKNFKPEDFSRKIEILKSKVLSGYEIESVCYTLDEM